MLNSVYDITDNSAPNGSIGVYESLGQYANTDDLAEFQTLFGLPSQTAGNVVGGYYGTARNVGEEANLDIQYLMGVAHGKSKNSWYWYDGPDCYWDDWISKVSNSANYPLIFSISYGGYEDSNSGKHLFNTEAIKLSAKGVTIVVSTGDDGTPGHYGRDYAGKSEAEQSKYCKKHGYSPQWPATSPYVVSVGATQGPESGTEEIACSSRTGGGITSGGGFSEAFSVPDYQKKYVNAYFETPNGAASKSGYKRKGRGYPDVAMLGHNYLIVFNGTAL